MTVVSISGDGSDMSKPNEEIVALLEGILERAKSGDICGVGVIALHNDSASSYWIKGLIGTYGLLGVCDMVKSEIMEVLQS